jgi:ring-1,2-phenylacetyl-CoA epoxidase subunit PaaE
LLIDRAVVGDKLYTTGAAGLFILSDDLYKYDQVFFFAAGIGITPIFSLIKTLLHTEPDKKVVLIYSNRSRDEAVFFNALNELSEQFAANFKLEFLYSSSFDLSRARLSKALLPSLLDEYAVVPKEKMLFYICGPFTYMRMVVISLEEQGTLDEQIKKENFNTNDQHIKKVEPPDKSSHMATLFIGGAEYTFPINYPDTILQGAKRNGISLPYSCEVGRCGSCAAICTSGEVWLSYNEVLMDAELKKGRILTCVGHPINGDVTIVI